MRCIRCNYDETVLPAEIDPDLRGAFGATMRRGEHLTAIRELRVALGIGLGEAKFISLHVTIATGVCHRCKAPLPAGVETTCPKCHALYLDW